METKAISKAEAKRQKQNLEYINNTLRRKLTSFEDRYLEGSVNWALGAHKRRIVELKRQIAVTEGKNLSKDKWAIQDAKERLIRLEKQVIYKSIVTLEAIVDAKRIYDAKVDGVVQLLISEGFEAYKYQVEEVGTAGGELEFLITNEVKEVHARFIYVNGAIKAPHFRFITTVRKQK